MALKYIPARHGFALGEAIHRSQQHSGTPLGLAVKSIYAPRTELTNSYNFEGYGSHVVDYQGQALNPDRLIVITDEQSQDPVPNPQGKVYMINVANYEHGVGYAPWVHIDGWSEQVISFIRELENSKLN